VGTTKAGIEMVRYERQLELDEDIKIVKQRLRDAKTFEATVALKRLRDKLAHERRVCR
jgi:hypothetical protein